MTVAGCGVDGLVPVVTGLTCAAYALSEGASTELVAVAGSSLNRPVVPTPSWSVIEATMTSLACVAAGRLMLSDVALLAVPLLALTAPRNPMMKAPGQVSSTSHSFAAGRQTAPGLPGGCRQVVLAPSQVSVVQGSPSSRQGAPALPAGCVHVALVPLHTSAVQGLPSSVQGVVLDLKRSVGQVALVPVQVSAMSHSFVAVRHTVLADRKPLAGQVVLVPVQVSATSHGPATARHVAPAFPAGCWQALLVPSH